MLKQRGFTIVELLIVIVVIGILAAITIVAYNGIQNRARVSSVNSALTQVVKKIAIWQVDNPGVSPTDLATLGITNSGGVIYQYTQTGAGTTYCVTASVATVSYKIDSSTASTTPVQGVCSGHTADGYVVNLATNPSFESGTTGWPGAQASVSQSAVWAANGTSSIKITPTSGASTDSFTSIGCSTCLVGLSVGSTYTFSGTINIPTPQTGTLDSRARTIVAYSWIGASASLLGQSTATPNTTGSTRKSVTFTIPASTDGVQIRLYNGATTVADNSVYWDSVMLTQGSTGYSFADGNSPGWVWNGIANNATSTGPPL